MYEDNPLLAPQVIEAAPAWEMQRDESRRAYEAFLLYRDSETRRLAEVGSKLTPPCSAANVARWSSRHRWQDRAWAWDKEQDRIQQAQQARDRMAARKRHLQVSQEMQAIALHGLLELKAKVAAGTALGMTPGEVENMLTESIKLERLTLGVEKDRRQFTEIRIFFGTHTYEGEEAHEERFEELPPPTPQPYGEDDGGEQRKKALPMMWETTDGE
jgi:hypothetical protein